MNVSKEQFTRAIKREAKRMEKDIDRMLGQVRDLTVQLEDEGFGLYSAHFSSMYDGLLRAKEAAELLS